jgi:hypothetical protein
MANMNADKMKRYGDAYVKELGCTGDSSAVAACLRDKPVRGVVLPFLGHEGRWPCPDNRKQQDFWCKNKPFYRRYRYYIGPRSRLYR